MKPSFPMGMLTTEKNIKFRKNSRKEEEMIGVHMKLIKENVQMLNAEGKLVAKV